MLTNDNNAKQAITNVTNITDTVTDTDIRWG